MAKKVTETDCRTEDGVTVGLIDGMKKRDFSPDCVKEALKDLRDDEDVAYLIKEAKKAK